VAAQAATFMNKSGIAVVSALRYYKIEPEQCLVAHDDLDLPAGTVRMKFDGGHGGQNGLRDIMAHLGHGKFHRLRVGIGHPGHKDQVTPWVLGRPSYRRTRTRSSTASASAGRAAAGGGRPVRKGDEQLHTPSVGDGVTGIVEIPRHQLFCHSPIHAIQHPDSNPWASNAASSVCLTSASPPCSTR
jgi:hypothetical protein